MNAKAIALIAAALVSGAGLSFAQDGRWDRVTLTNGRVLQGSVSRDGDHYLLRLPLGSIRVPASQVDTIEAQHDPMDEMEHMQQAGFPNGTLGQRQRYAAFCAEQGLTREAKRAYERVLLLDPGNESAHAALGHVQHNGAWMTPAERARHLAAERRAAELAHARQMRAQGFVRHEGEWMKPAERDRRVALAARERAERLERERVARLEREAREARERAAQQEREHRERLARIEAQAAQARANAVALQQRQQNFNGVACGPTRIATSPIRVYRGRQPRQRTITLGFSQGTLRYQRRQQRLNQLRRVRRQVRQDCQPRRGRVRYARQARQYQQPQYRARGYRR